MKTALIALTLGLGLIAPATALEAPEAERKRTAKSAFAPIGLDLLRPVITPPEGAPTDDKDPQDWMIGGTYESHLADEAMRIARAHQNSLRRLPDYARYRAALRQLSKVGDDRILIRRRGEVDFYVTAGELFRVDRESVLFSPGDHTDYSSWSLEGWSFSPSGEKAAVSISSGGSEVGVIKIVDPDTGAVEPYEIGPMVTADGDDVFWLSETVVAYREAQTTSLSEDPNAGALWKLFDLETGETTHTVFGDGIAGLEVDPSYWVTLWSRPEASDRTLAYLWRGNFLLIYHTPTEALLRGEPEWKQILLRDTPDADPASLGDAESFGDKALVVAADPNGLASLYTYSYGDSTTELIAEGRPDLSYSFAMAFDHGVYVFAASGAVHRLFFTADGETLNEVELPFEGIIDSNTFSAIIGAEDEIKFYMSSPDHPSEQVIVKHGEVLSHAPASTPLEELGIELSLSRTIEFAKSADGTRVPVTVLENTEAPDTATRATILSAYGSYGSTSEAFWDPAAAVWAREGGVYATCHVRGGGYFGPAWHTAGMGPDKTKTHEDIVACAEHLIATGRTSPKRLALEGGSAGALAVGPVAYDRPDLIGALLVDYGDLNPLRMLEGANGLAQIDEIGDPRDPEQRLLMETIDTVEIARAADQSPPMFLCFGVQDSRVPFWMSMRLADIVARNHPDTEVAIFADRDAGHSCGFGRTSARDAQAQKFAWLANALGVGTPIVVDRSGNSGN